MENHDNDPITAFDTLYTSNQLQMLKIVLPYMQTEMQKFIAIYIKLNELLIALQFTKNKPLNSSFPLQREMNMADLLKYLSPYLSEAEKEMMNQFTSFQENMEQFKQMSQMMQMMNDMEGSPESMLQNFLSEEQMAMFNMFEEELT